jgi:hypothetical protein
MENLNEKKLLKAKLKIAEIKKFYEHVVIYILVNLFLTFIWSFSFKLAGNFITSNQFDGDGFTHIPIWLIWGIFLGLHALKTFGFSHIFGIDREKRKIDELMKK